MSGLRKECALWYILDGKSHTAGDLREFVEALNKLEVPDEYVLTDCIVSFVFEGKPELIIDGESAPYKDRYDIILPVKFDENVKD
jgi:hypothetical protein